MLCKYIDTIISHLVANDIIYYYKSHMKLLNYCYSLLLINNLILIHFKVYINYYIYNFKILF